MVPVESMRVMKRRKGNAMRAHMDENGNDACLFESPGDEWYEKRRTEQSHDKVVVRARILMTGGNQRACERHSARTQSGVLPR
jgi:hypothetical protein